MNINLWPFSRKNSGTPIRTSLDLFREVFGLAPVKSGANVNWTTSFEVSTVMACARVIADGISQVPFKLFQDSGGGARVAVEHPLYELLHLRPNDWMTSFEFRETMALHVVLTGNAIAFKNFVGDSRELIPFMPQSVTIRRNNDYTITYIVTAPSGARQEFPQEVIWHWRGPSWDSVVGMDSVKMAREAIGLAMATEETQARLHKNGLKGSGGWSVEGVLTKEAHKALRDWIESEYGGAENAGKPFILDRNGKYQPYTQSGVDAQHLETRKYQVEEICRPFRVMPIMVGYSDKSSTYASAEAMFIAHVVHTLSPWYSRIEQSAAVSLLTPKERADGYYFKFIANGLMRGSYKDRGEYYARALGSGGSRPWMTQDDVRALEEMNPMGGNAGMLLDPPGGNGGQSTPPNGA